MANTTYTVQKGDSMWGISERFLGSGARWKELAAHNSLPVIMYNGSENCMIHPGQVLRVDVDNPGSAVPPTTNKYSNEIKVVNFGLQSDTDSTLYAQWTSKQGATTKEYHYIWRYKTADGKEFVGADSTQPHYPEYIYQQCTYNIPSNAVSASFTVTAIPEPYVDNEGKELPGVRWTCGWSTKQTFYATELPPATPGSAPEVIQDGNRLTFKVTGLDTSKIRGVQFNVIHDKKGNSNHDVGIQTNGSATLTGYTVYYGYVYNVRYRTYSSAKVPSDWSPWSEDIKAIPNTPTISSVKATSSTSIELKWDATGGDSYTIEYATKRTYFDVTDETTTKDNIEGTRWEFIGLESGQEYFFRVKAVNTAGDSSWSPIKSIKIGTKPAAPTTWSSTTTVIVGETLNLYWIHNSSDESSQTKARLELTINGVKQIKELLFTEEDKTTSVYSIDTSSYREGAKILWRVQTAGITGEYGEYSTQRTVEVYAIPVLSMVVKNYQDASLGDTLTSFPFKISATAGPNSQAPLGYYLSIKALESYETVDYMGNTKFVNANEEVYAKNFDITGNLDVTISASDVNLDNNQRYIITCEVTMNSGLTATSTHEFTVAWVEEQYQPNAEIWYDPETYTTNVRPYVDDENGVLLENIAVSLYRRESDGSFVELAAFLDNTDQTYVIDPHPALDYARYRVVAISKLTGAVSYYDVPGFPIGEKAIIIQWNEDWHDFDVMGNDPLAEKPWTGSLLRLPYNIDTTDGNEIEVAHVEYIGRKNPVSYYGTHQGVTSTWNVEIEKSDIQTIYALRRLAIYMGDVYVREPSGTGYWASIKVSFTQTHCEVKVPVTLSLTKVEGGK